MNSHQIIALLVQAINSSTIIEKRGICPTRIPDNLLINSDSYDTFTLTESDINTKEKLDKVSSSSKTRIVAYVGDKNEVIFKELNSQFIRNLNDKFKIRTFKLVINIHILSKV